MTMFGALSASSHIVDKTLLRPQSAFFLSLANVIAAGAANRRRSVGADYSVPLRHFGPVWKSSSGRCDVGSKEFTTVDDENEPSTAATMTITIRTAEMGLRMRSTRA
jgi:hypothetical protein